MMKRGRFIVRNHMTLVYNFSGIRVQDTVLTPVDWQLSVDLVALDKKNKTKQSVEYNASVAYQRIYFWLETNMPNVILVDVSKEDDLYLANLSSNIALYCHTNTNDDVLIQLLHSKFTALAGEDIVVGEMQLRGSDTSIVYTFDCVDGVYTLPLTVAEYMPDVKTRDEIPWWNRNDGFCFELTSPSEDSEDSAESNDVFDPMEEFNRVLKENTDLSVGVVKEPATIVKVEKWQPKKVE